MNPRVRPLDARWIRHQGEQTLLLQDRQGFLPGPMLAPPAVAVLLSLCDGTRDIDTLATAYRLRTGEPATPQDIQRIIDELDEALVFESPRFLEALAEQLAAYRAAPHRDPFHAGAVYPERVDDLLDRIAAWRPDVPAQEDLTVSAVISPHIDYARGGPVYGATWRAATAAARAADYDSSSAPILRRLTGCNFTRHGYPRTPFGIRRARRRSSPPARAIGEGDFTEEIHHRTEHSIELAAVWLHWAIEGRSTPIVPILCGSFAPYTDGERDPAADRNFAAVLDALHTALDGKRVLAVAAADLAHVGPAFGDGPFREAEQANLRQHDERTLATIQTGDAAGFFGDLRAERDARKYCGLPPIYLTLRYLEQSQGEVIQYDQCPADDEKTSWVSIAGALLR
ncbi:MAG: AmmeMemoRadiSam system protein B [Dehalococcoidia bacterium]